MDYITGNKFKKNCHHSYDEQGYIVHSEPINNEVLKIFVKSDYIHNFFNRKIDTPYILFTHNSDLPIDDSYLQYLDNEKLVKWYGQNITTKHSKLFSIPIGIANEIWEHGNEKVFNEVIQKNLQKERLIYVNFDVKTNPNERNYCLNEIRNNGLDMSNKLPFKEYLEELSKINDFDWLFSEYTEWLPSLELHLKTKNRYKKENDIEQLQARIMEVELENTTLKAEIKLLKLKLAKYE